MNISALRCPYCGKAQFEQTADAIVCTSCSTAFPIVHGVINTLVKPDAEVVRELQGMLDEEKEKGEAWQKPEELIVRHVPHVARQAEREADSEKYAKNYYRSTRLSFEQAMGMIDLTGRKTVLEIGAENELPFLKPFEDRGMDCFAMNIHFVYDDTEEVRPKVTKVAGDMNRLPFRDDYFDVVVMSATSHHSPDLDRTMGEIARVMRRGGVFLLLNDPIHGAAKHLWDKLTGCANFAKGSIRHSLIHENEFTIGEYRRSFRKHGFRLRASLFPAYYDEKLMSGKVDGVRWSVVAKGVSKMWRVPALRGAIKAVGLPVGQRVLGLEMNVILERV